MKARYDLDGREYPVTLDMLGIMHTLTVDEARALARSLWYAAAKVEAAKGLVDHETGEPIHYPLRIDKKDRS